MRLDRVEVYWPVDNPKIQGKIVRNTGTKAF